MYEDDVTPTLFLIFVNLYNIVFSDKKKSKFQNVCPRGFFLASKCCQNWEFFLQFSAVIMDFWKSDQVFKLKFSGLSNFMYSNRYAKFHQHLRVLSWDLITIFSIWHGMTYNDLLPYNLRLYLRKLYWQCAKNYLHHIYERNFLITELVLSTSKVNKYTQGDVYIDTYFTFHMRVGRRVLNILSGYRYSNLHYPWNNSFQVFRHSKLQNNVKFMDTK